MTSTQIFAIIACIAFLLRLFIDPICDLCAAIYHKICDILHVCYHPNWARCIKFDEQYIDKDGNEYSEEEIEKWTSEEYFSKIKKHHTWKVYYCSLCGKIFKREQLQ